MFNKYFVTIILFVLFNVNSVSAQAQTLFGLNLNDVNDTTGFVYNNSLDAAGTDVYLKNDPGIFDRILLHKGLGFDCLVNNPNASRLAEIYYEIVKFCGYENEIKDKYSEDISHIISSDDFNQLTFFVLEGKAVVLRYWYKDKYNIKLEFTKKNLEVFISIS